MNRTDALIKGLRILVEFEKDRLVLFEDMVLAGPEDHAAIDAHAAKQLDDLGWHVTIFGWAFKV